MSTHFEPSDIAQRLQIEGIPDAEFTVYDGAGWEYIVDLPNKQAFRIVVTPYRWTDDDGEVVDVDGYHLP